MDVQEVVVVFDHHAVDIEDSVVVATLIDVESEAFTHYLIGVLLLACLIRAIKGPRVADRLIAVNMMGTMIVITICVLAFLMTEGYLVDIAMIYTMLSFLAVVLLTKVYMGIYLEKHAKAAAKKEEKTDA